jgi:urease accessory protein
MKTAFLRAGVAIATTLLSSAAHAHPGHGDGALAGLLHPLLGPDHLLAMLATGLWAAQLKGRAQWLLPASFLGAMALAAFAAVAGFVLPGFELGVAGSLMLAGLLLAFRVQVAPLAGAAIVGLFALFHGYAHGAELPAAAVAWHYFAGFLLSSLVLLRAGQVFGPVLVRWKAALPAAGALLVASGGWMAAALASAAG